MREFDLLKHVYQWNRTLPRQVAIAPGDDMAMVQLDGNLLLSAVDQVVEGRHFCSASATPAQIGHKAVARSLSDIAAMAARPTAALAAVTLPADFGESKALQLFDAMRGTAERYECPLIGGDIAFHKQSTDPLVCSVTVFAEPGPAGFITRSGAQAGDVMYVTGRLGGSLEQDGSGRHLTFQPRIDLALKLAQLLGQRLHAMIDISDGLGRDAGHIAQMSGVQIRILSERVPCSIGCDWTRAMSDGEDYELCFAASGDVPEELLGIEITRVGVVQKAHDGHAGVVVCAGDREVPADEMGWEHHS